jgi:hypothetical protein
MATRQHAEDLVQTLLGANWRGFCGGKSATCLPHVAASSILPIVLLANTADNRRGNDPDANRLAVVHGPLSEEFQTFIVEHLKSPLGATELCTRASGACDQRAFSLPPGVLSAVAAPDGLAAVWRVLWSPPLVFFFFFF